jgi:hypothetical protein
MALAVMRGFCTMPMWCPLSITMALMFSLVPGAHWTDYALIGVGMTCAYIILGRVADKLEFPAVQNGLIHQDSGGWRAIAVMIAQVGLITSLALWLEARTGVAFLAHMLVVVPCFAFGWAVWQARRDGFGRALANGAVGLAKRARASMPGYANEATLFATSTLLGALVVALLPADFAPALFKSLHLSVDAFLVFMIVSVAGLAVIGLNPMITLTLILSSLGASPVEGLTPLRLVVAATGAWSLSLGMSPLNGSMVMFANIVGVQSETIAWRWNGLFSLAVLALFCVFVYFARF